MQTKKTYFGLMAVIAAFILTSCGSSINMTSWKNPAENTQINKLVVMPLFDKLEYIQPFEQYMDHYFNSKGLASVGSLEFLNPSIKYPIDDIKRKADSLGANAILVFVYKGTDQSETYVPPTTYYTGGYGGYWGGGYWGGGYWGGSVYTTGGYWTSTSTVNLTGNLYMKGSQQVAWTCDLAITDPEYIDQVAVNVAQYILGDWQSKGMVAFAQSQKKK